MRNALEISKELTEEIERLQKENAEVMEKLARSEVELEEVKAKKAVLPPFVKQQWTDFDGDYLSAKPHPERQEFLDLKTNSNHGVRYGPGRIMEIGKAFCKWAKPRLK